MSKQVERFESWGYWINRDSIGYLSHRYTGFARWTDIHHSGTGKDPAVPINTFGVKDGHTNMLLIARAYNNSPDHDPRPRSHKLTLRAQIVSYWTSVERRSLSELSRIVYANVNEQTLKDLIKDVYEIMGAPMDKGLLITRDHPPFDTLLTRTPFGGGVQKMLHEYADAFGIKDIKSFYFHLNNGINNFNFIIDLA
ncbi:hypothetical protein KVR01_013707 [Diaporthe batatas]|uniref:uncharacterized protein n=1 Tax=Diaporthe batatas TaxID=748121 RepID=UPI001D045B98|nr:uncharacterized protein KVR01_013707 [Diaporthe batatas]KAG8156473.1 hypothetical protein KVR01_013707 [Diaporthe batatas]